MNTKCKDSVVSAEERPGKILKIQCGYNANSGSLASFVVSMPIPFMVTVTAFGALTALASSILLSRLKK